MSFHPAALANRAMLCPTCDVPLAEESFEGQPVDRCPRCGGLWFDESQLGQVVRRIDKPQVTGDEPECGPEGIDCPRCGAAMRLANYAEDSGVLINTCPSCAGAWLAAGQLELIAQYRLGTPATRALGDALGAQMHEANLWRRFRNVLRSRVLSGIVAVAFALLAWQTRGGRLAVLRVRFLTLALTLSLLCIWFADGMGNRIGVGLGLGQPAVTERTPGDWVAIAGWLLLLSAGVAVIIVIRR